MERSWWNFSKLCLGMVVLVVLATGLEAQQCSTKTTAGRYKVLCDGFLTPGPNAPLLPAKELATVNANQNGTFTSDNGKISFGGTIVVQTVTGTEQLNSDCTGSITFSQTINGQPAPPLHIDFVVSENGDKIDGLALDSGTVFSCRLTRLRDGN